MTSAAVDGREVVVAVIDDDADVREALEGLFRSVGLGVEVYGSTASFLDRHNTDQPGCLVLDVRLPGKSGLDFQEELTKRRIRCPIVFISGHADVAMSVRAMKGGAVEFLTKPVRDQDLLDAVHLAVQRDRTIRAEDHRTRHVKAQFAGLTMRERDVMTQVVLGRRNKQIAADLGISEATIKLHRAHIMQKLDAQNLVELIRIADLCAALEPRSPEG
jgi:FixJ family two-component response regulator